MNRYPTFDELQSTLEELTTGHTARVRTETLTRSPEGREVIALGFSDPTIPTERKQTALVVCGRHGNELGTRAVALETAAWLVSDHQARRGRRDRV